MHRLHFLPEVVGGWGNNCHQPGRCREIFQFFPNIVFFVILKYFLSWQVSRNISVFSIYIFFVIQKYSFILAGLEKYFSFFLLPNLVFLLSKSIFFILAGGKKHFSFFLNYSCFVI